MTALTQVNPWVVFAVASVAVFLVSVDATIAVAAFPSLRGSFTDSSPATLSWVLNAYTILYAALLVPAGRLVDLHGAKRLFLFGVALFTLASAACGTAPGTGSLIVKRTVQAVGGTLLTPRVAGTDPRRVSCRQAQRHRWTVECGGGPWCRGRPRCGGNPD